MTPRGLAGLVVIALVFGGVFAGARAAAARWAIARGIFVFAGIASLLGGVWLYFALPRLIPDRPAPGLTVVYYGGWLLSAALALLGVCAAAGAATAPRPD